MLRIGVLRPTYIYFIFNKNVGDGTVLLVRIKRVYGFCFKELCSFCKSPPHFAHSRSNLTELRSVVLVTSYVYDKTDLRTSLNLFYNVGDGTVLLRLALNGNSAFCFQRFHCFQTKVLQPPLGLRSNP